MEQGVKSFSARKVIKGMNKKAVGGSREKASMVVNWLQQQVNNKVGMGADLMPTSDGAKHLPIRNKKEGYAQLLEAFGKNDSAVPSYSYFNKVWRSEDEVHNIKTQRKVGTLERCGVCRKLDMEVESAKAEDNIKLAELSAKNAGHKLLQKYERRFYNSRKFLALSQPDQYLSCIIDSSTQYSYDVPYTREKYKGLDTSNCLGQSLTGVLFHGRKLFVYPQDKYLSGGSNWICTA